MSNDLIRSQRPDKAVHLDEVFVPDHQKNVISRLRETGHVPYRCTKMYATTQSDNKGCYLNGRGASSS